MRVFRGDKNTVDLNLRTYIGQLTSIEEITIFFVLGRV